MGKKFLRSKPMKIVVLCLLCMGIIVYLKSSSKTDNGEFDLDYLSKHVNKLIKTQKRRLPTEGQVCRVPVLDVNATEILKLMQKVPKVTCGTPRDWVEVVGSTLRITDWAKKRFGNVECTFTEIIRENDYRQSKGITTASSTEYNLESTDVVQVHCISPKGRSWHKVVTGIRSDQDIFDRTSWSKVPKDSLKLNVLMFGFDSVSHSMWKRKLPKAYRYATKDLKGIALNGYNIVGDGTPQALLPILTGKTELELPETRKRMQKATYVNVYPFIWNDFQDNGYVTAWSEDLAEVGTFNYRLKGFKEQPVDHYMRPYFLESLPHYENEKRYCYGELSRFQIVLNFVRNIYEVYKTRPKFVFAFHSEYSHDNYDMVANADDDLTEWLQEFNNKGYLNDTLLILMSDHGSRFSNVRKTQQGKLEERLPAFIFVFPSWFEKKYPEAYKNFKKNVDRLSTPFDIHETLADVLHFQGPSMGDVRNRGISLFKEIPLSRSCTDAGIEPHWCTCLEWEPLPVTNRIVIEAAMHLSQFLNSFTYPHRDLCMEIKLSKILWSAKLVPSEDILKFKKTSDLDGLFRDMSDRTEVSVEIYQIQASFDPGDMIFEASIRYYTSENKFVISEREINRINRYKHMTHCIEYADILHHLRKFCNCRSDKVER